MNNLSFLIDELRRLKVIGPASDFSSGTIIYESSDSLLIRLPCGFPPDYRSWVLVWRSSRQYFRVGILTLPRMWKCSFRNYRLTADYINNFFRR